MEPSRPDPDELLASLTTPAPRRAILKVFLGYAAGVGKSYALLQAANAALGQGRDVVVGWIEPHDRPDTILLLAGMQAVAPRVAQDGGLSLRDLDLDACLARRPEVLLVDELAHSNAPGGRHKKRWQDVEELLDAGIEVWTTVNIQHFESMNDVVARVTGVRVAETVPDRVLDTAGEVEVVDLDPEDLIDRLRQGKVYAEAQARRALESFFQKPNLLALRELTLRRAADRVGRQVDSARAQKKVEAIWPVRERLMVSVGPSPLSEDLLRQAWRLAQSLDAELLAVTIETPAQGVRDAAAQARLARNLTIAASLGAETVVLQGEEVARDLVAYARKRNVTKLVVGKNRDRRWGPWARRTIGDELLRLSGDIDVYVLSGRNPTPEPSLAPRPTWKDWSRGWGWSALVQAGFTALAVVFESWGMAEANLVLTLLMGVVVAAAYFGLGASIFSSVLAVLAFNYFFTLPIHSLAVDDPQYYLIFLFLLVVGAVVGTLTQRLRVGIQTARDREQKMEALNRLHRELSHLVDAEQVRTAAGALVGELLGLPVRVIQRSGDRTWTGLDGPESPDLVLFDWALTHGQPAGRGTGTLFNHRLSVWPLVGSRGTAGLLVIEGAADRTGWVESLAAMVASALERVALIDETRAQDRAVETERTRNALLHGLSHDLRTPLTIMAGTLETLTTSAETSWSDRDRRLVDTVRQETLDLAAQVENLLDLSRLTERGQAWPLEPVPADEPLWSAVARFRALRPDAVVRFSVPEEVALVTLEPRLVEQALGNYLDNAAEYAAGSPLDVTLELAAQGVRYEVADRGPGVVEADRQAIFQRFQRGGEPKASGRRGTGLGLAIVAEVARVHRGSAGVEAREGGGARFFLTLATPTPEARP